MTREEFLEEFRSGYPVWGSKAMPSDMGKPSSERILQGWVVERPPHTLFNWHMHRTDTRLDALEARVAWLEQQLAAKA